MSETRPGTDAEQVAHFLRENPDFFLAHADLLAELKLPHGDGGAAVSLVERQVAVLRERNVELRERLNALLSVARDNDLIYEKTRALVLALLEAATIDELARVLMHSLLEDFGMAAAALLLHEAPAGALPARVRVVEAAEAEARIGDLVKGHRVVCGVLRPEELAYVFGDGADAVGSAAIIPLSFDGAHALLAIGARDPQHFRSGMDTLFVGHIGEVLARRLAGVLMTAGRDRQRAGG